MPPFMYVVLAILLGSLAGVVCKTAVQVGCRRSPLIAVERLAILVFIALLLSGSVLVKMRSLPRPREIAIAIPSGLFVTGAAISWFSQWMRIPESRAVIWRAAKVRTASST